MKAYVLEDIVKLEYKDVDLPEIAEDEALVEIKATGICASDIPRIFETGTYTFPTIPGHEFSGVVRAVKGNSKWLNKRVGVFPLIPCKRCQQCLEKKYEMCKQYSYLGSRTDGGFAEYVKVPIWNLIELPENITYEKAAMIEPAAVALHAIRKLDIQMINNAVVYGAGTIGLLCGMWLRKLGVENVMIVAKHPTQKEFAKKMGFNNVCGIYDVDPVEWILNFTDNKGAQVVFECVGSNESIINSILSAQPCGKIVVVGNPKEDTEIPKNAYWQILRKQLEIVGSWNSTFDHIESDDWHITLRGIEDGTLPVHKLITHKILFENLNQGLIILKEKKEYAVKIMAIR